MQPDHRARYTLGFALLAALLAALILWNLNTGSLHLSPAEVADILLTRTGENAAVVWEIRLPRLIAALLLGGALSVSGFLLQTIFAVTLPSLTVSCAGDSTEARPEPPASATSAV